VHHAARAFEEGRPAGEEAQRSQYAKACELDAARRVVDEDVVVVRRPPPREVSEPSGLPVGIGIGIGIGGGGFGGRSGGEGMSRRVDTETVMA
jgi:hypothetical protein